MKLCYKQQQHFPVQHMYTSTIHCSEKSQRKHTTCAVGRSKKRGPILPKEQIAQFLLVIF